MPGSSCHRNHCGLPTSSPPILPNCLVHSLVVAVDTNLLDGVLDILNSVLAAIQDAPKAALDTLDTVLIRDGRLAEGMAGTIVGLHNGILIHELDGVLDIPVAGGHDAVVLGPQVIVQLPPAGLPLVLDGLVELLLRGLLVLAREVVLLRDCKYSGATPSDPSNHFCVLPPPCRF